MTSGSEFFLTEQPGQHRLQRKDSHLGMDKREEEG